MKFVLISCLLIITSCSSTPKGKTYKLTILHTNDHHGRFWPNREGEVGLAARSTLINQLRNEARKKGSEVLLLDAGDVNTGVPQSDLLDAEPDFKGMKLLNYDVMAVGNHEFDKNLKTLYRQRDWAGFPFISANIYDQKTNKRIFPSHITKNLNGLRITIFGLTTEDTPLKSKVENTHGLRFVPAVQEAKELVPKLRKNTDVLIALTHIGHYPDEKHGADAPGDVTLARKVNGIDLIVGGHTQKPLFKPDVQNGTIIVQAFEWGKYLGKVELEVTGNKVKLLDYQLIPVNLKDSKNKIAQDPKIEHFLRPYKEKGDKSLLVKVGTAKTEYIGRRDIIRGQETNLGNLVARSLREKFNADLAIMNSGGIRDSIYPGAITIETVMMVLPFAGEIVSAEMSGKELKAYLEHVFVNLTPGSGSFPQTDNLEVVMNKSTGKAKSIKIGGKDLIESQSYLMALPEFIAKGGDKYPAVKYRKYGYGDADVLKEYILKLKTLGNSDFAPKGKVKFE